MLLDKELLNTIYYRHKPSYSEQAQGPVPELGIGVDGRPLFAIIEVGIFPDHNVTIPNFVTLTTEGRLELFGPYASDGPSVPIKNALRKIGFASQIDRMFYPSWAHDIGCQMRAAGLITTKMKHQFDELFYQQCVKCGVWRWVTKIAKKAVYNHKPKPEPETQVTYLPR